MTCDLQGIEYCPLKLTVNLEKPTVSDNSPPESIWDGTEHMDKRDMQLPPHLQHLDMSYTYTPHDIAEYIFWTGDEGGVTLALAELLDNDVVNLPIS